ncbi:surface lipoprotein assembly modifier, partial [Actinobacillus minor]
RLGWGQEWNLWGLSTRLNLSFMKRDYKDIAKLGGFLSLGKVREDKVYSSSLTLWKRDWHLWNITPKLQFSWKKYDSNLPTLYSYTDKNINLLFETRF